MRQRKIISRAHLRKVCLLLRLIAEVLLTKFNFSVQYSWLPDVLRVQGSVRVAIMSHSTTS